MIAVNFEFRATDSSVARNRRTNPIRYSSSLALITPSHFFSHSAPTVPCALNTPHRLLSSALLRSSRSRMWGGIPNHVPIPKVSESASDRTGLGINPYAPAGGWKLIDSRGDTKKYGSSVYFFIKLTPTPLSLPPPASAPHMRYWSDVRSIRYTRDYAAPTTVKSDPTRMQCSQSLSPSGSPGPVQDTKLSAPPEPLPEVPENNRLLTTGQSRCAASDSSRTHCRHCRATPCRLRY